MGVLVTGGSGFVGQHLLRALMQRGRTVRSLCRAPVPEAPAAAGALQQVAGDVNDAASLAVATAGATTVYHAAAVVPGRGSGGSMWETNVAGTQRVAQACVRAGVRRLVLVSSVAVYRAPLDGVVCESAPSGGIEPYGRSKSEAENAALRACGDRVELVILRPCQVYGPMDRSGYTARLLRLAASPVLPVAGGAARGFSLLHVCDLADALCAAGEAEGVAGMLFNIAPRTRTSLLQLADVHAAWAGRRRGLALALPPAALRAALSLRWMAGHLRQGNGIAFKSYAPGHTHGSLLLGGPLYDSQRAAVHLRFRASMTPEQAWPHLMAGAGGPPQAAASHASGGAAGGRGRR